MVRVREYIVAFLGLAFCSTASLLAQSQVGHAVPFEFRDGLLWVRVQLMDSSRTLLFLLDTGATVSALDEQVARRLGVALGERVKVQGVKTEAIGYWPLKVTGRVGDYRLPEKLLAVDLSMLGSACCQPVDGLLGADFLKDKSVQLDFQNRQLRFGQSPVSVNPNVETVPLKIRGGTLLVPIYVNGGKIQWVRLDTGCASALQWVDRKEVSDGRNEKVSVGLALIGIPWNTTRIKLGRLEFDQVPTGIHRQRIFNGEDGLLGNGLLTKFDRVTIDVPGKRLVLEKLPDLPNDQTFTLK